MPGLLVLTASIDVVMVVRLGVYHHGVCKPCVKSAAKATEADGRPDEDHAWALGCTTLISEVAAAGFGRALWGSHGAVTVFPSQDGSENCGRYMGNGSLQFAPERPVLANFTCQLD